MKLSSRSSFPRPRRFRKKRLLVIGCGACGLHIVQQKARHWRIIATTTQASKLTALRSLGALPLLMDLDQTTRPHRRWAALAPSVIMLAPPQRNGHQDTRTRRLSHWLRHPKPPIVTLPEPAKRQSLVYVSTSGVYGNAEGRWIDETHPLHPQSDRAKRRVDAEQTLRHLGKTSAWSITLLRAPGIYSPTRLPRKRLEAATPCLHDHEDSYSNHISETDLARCAVIALHRGRPQRVFHASDDQPLKIGAYFDAVADALGLPRPPRASRQDVQQQLTPMQWSFLRESRRLSNRRLREELRMTLRYPSVHDALANFFR